MSDINKEFEEEVNNFAKFFHDYRKGEEEYYEGMIKKISEIIETTEED